MELDKKNLSIYIHIPFCVKKCDYCDFLSFPVGECGKKDDSKGNRYSFYVEALLREIKAMGRQYRKEVVDTIFIGGGTPSLLPIDEMHRIMNSVRQNFIVLPDAEITMEANPGTLTEEKLQAYHRMGINRLSIGLQSAKDSELKKLGRIHDFSVFQENYRLARSAGFDNISVDLMSGLPGQSVEDYRESLEIVASLNPEHISAYGLIIEEGTEFYHRYHGEEGEKLLPSEEEEREMYHLTGQILKQYGYYQYEISNYAKPGFESKHNTGYWIRKPYLGLGLGASSFYGETRWKNTDCMDVYLSFLGEQGKNKLLGIHREIHGLTIEEQMEETMFLGLRMNQGVSGKAFFAQFEKSLEEVYGEWIQKMVSEELLEADENIRLTEKGRDLANYVMAGFLFN